MILVAVFYAIALPLAIPVFAGSGNAGVMCTFIVLMPIGFVLGVSALIGRRQPIQPHGFPVLPPSEQTKDD